MRQRSAVIVAGGKGLRMKSALPKQFMLLNGKPIVIHTIEAFLQFDPDIQIVLVLQESLFEVWAGIHQTYLPHTEVHLAAGGDTRFQSVKSGLQRVGGGIVAIHDAVRPLISTEVISASFKSAEEFGSGVVMVPLKDSIRRREGTLTQAADRSSFLLVQTPQTFQVALIKQAFEQEEQPVFTDDASVYEAAGMQVSVVMGDYQNIKITTSEDLSIAEALMSRKSP